MSEDELGTLKLGEIHPAANIAFNYLNPMLLMKWQESLTSSALSGNRMAEIGAETCRRLLNKELVSDRYLMGLAWIIWSLEND